MKRWPLRWKIAFYAATLGVIATLAGACTTWIVMRFSELALLDRKLSREAQEIFARIETTPRAADAVSQRIHDLAASDRVIQLWTSNGRLIFSWPRPISSNPGLTPGVFHTVSFEGRRLRMAGFQRGEITLLIGADISTVDLLGWHIVFGMFAAIPTVLVVITLGGRWVARQALAPIQTIQKAVSSVNLKNLDQRLPAPPAADEIAQLVSVFNATLDRLQRSFEQSVRFSAQASHQLKTPISVLRAGIEEILTDPQTPSKQQERANLLLHQVHQLTSIAENLLLLARADAGRLELRPTRFDLHDVIDGVCDDARALAESDGLTLEARLEPELPLLADRQSVALILQNLVENAVRYNQPGGFVCISAHAVDSRVEVMIKNNGAPIPPAQVPHIFERFYRAESDRRVSGQGLGLSVACELAKAQGGDLELVQSSADWTEFRLSLPAPPLRSPS